MVNEIAVTFLPGDTITAAKLNAMQQSLAVEGDYTSYKFVWSKSYVGTIGATSTLYIRGILNNGTVLVISGAQDTLYKITYSGAQSTLSTGLYTGYLYTESSALNTYVAFPYDVGPNTVFRIFKNAELLQTIDVADDDASVDAVGWVVFSPNGRYLAVKCSNTDNAYYQHVMLYEADV